MGKITIPDSVLLKPGKLTPGEFAVMQTHTTRGAAILAHGHSDVVRMAEAIALTHHERWDGSGYPQGLVRTAIPLPGRIVALVDVFDALTHERPYKKAWPLSAAVAEIQAQDGRQFDPQVVAAFLSVHARSEVPSEGRWSTGAPATPWAWAPAGRPARAVLQLPAEVGH